MVAIVVGVTPGRASADEPDRVLYASGRSVVDLTTGQTVVTSSAMINALGGLAESPDGSRLAVASAPDSSPLVGPYSVTTLHGADGSCPSSVNGIGTVAGLSWAPDSVRLAMSYFGNLAILDTGTPGATPVGMVGGTGAVTGVSWYPKASHDQIAFSRVVGNNDHAEIDLLDVATRTVVTLIGGGGFDSEPTWSPDGSRIAFVHADQRSGPGTLFVADADGTNARSLPTGLENVADPSWASDGTHLLVADKPTTDTAAAGIYRVDAASGTAERLTTGSHALPVSAPLGPRNGYVIVTGNGSTYGFGASCSAAAASGMGPVVAAAQDPALAGQWQVDAAGHVRALGAARWFGDLGGHRLNAPIVGVAGTPSGAGYWLVASDGGIFSFGDAAFHGSTGAMRLNRPIVGMASTPSGAGYWLVASDGGIFSFGDAVFRGSTGAMRLNRPIVGMASTPSGAGYWLVASDGGIFSFGDAAFRGSTGAMRLNRPIVGMAGTPSGAGYWLVASDGGIFTFGDATYRGSTGAITTPAPVVALVAERIP